MSTRGMAHSTPSAEGVDAAGIQAFLDAIAAHPDIEPHGLVVLRHGRVIAEGWWSPYSTDSLHLLYSLSKSFTSTALGFAVAEGLVDLDRTVLSYFPELDVDVTDPRSRAIKVRHVAAMASGHAAETLDRALAADPGNLVRGFLLTPPDADPGTVFAYNQPCTYSVAAIIQRESGQSLVDYLRPRLLDPLGISEVAWIESPPGVNLGFSGLHATTDAIARLGQLYLQGGRWGDRQLLSPEWVAEATSKQVDNPEEENPDWSQGYGFQFWMARHGYRGDGAYGQFCVVLPEQDMVVAINSQTPQMQAVLDALWEHVLPAVDRAGDDDSDTRLAHRLTMAELSPVGGDADPESADGWLDVALPASSTGGGEPLPPVWAGRLIDEVTVRSDDRGWVLRLSDRGGFVDANLGHQKWEVVQSNGVTMACSGGWTDSDTLVADVIFLQTPHRARITCSAGRHSAEVDWLTFPMHPRSVTELHAP